MHFPGDQWIFRESGIPRGVGDDQHLVVQNRIGAECVFTGGAVGIDSAFGQKFLVVASHQRDQRDRHPKQALRQQACLVETRFSRPIRKVVTENFLKAFFFVRRNGITAGERRQAGH
jgi:hypothetical protein